MRLHTIPLSLAFYIFTLRLSSDLFLYLLMVNLHCGLDWIWRLLGDTPLGVSECGSHHSIHELGPVSELEGKVGVGN